MVNIEPKDYKYSVEAKIEGFVMQDTHVTKAEKEKSTLVWFNSAGGAKNVADISIKVLNSKDKKVAEEINDYAVKLELVYAEDEKTKVVPKKIGKKVLTKIPSDLHLTKGRCEAKCKILAVTRSYEGKKFAIQISIPALENISCIAVSADERKYFIMKTKTKNEICDLKNRKRQQKNGIIVMPKRDSTIAMAPRVDLSLRNSVPMKKTSLKSIMIELTAMKKMMKRILQEIGELKTHRANSDINNAAALVHSMQYRPGNIAPHRSGVMVNPSLSFEPASSTGILRSYSHGMSSSYPIASSSHPPLHSLRCNSTPSLRNIYEKTPTLAKADNDGASTKPNNKKRKSSQALLYQERGTRRQNGGSSGM